MEPEVIFQATYESATNNRMELQACLKAFEWAKDNHRRHNISRILLITDSTYVCDNKNSAILWKQNNWRNQSGRPVENCDLWNKFLIARSKIGIRLDIQWSKGKITPLLDLVDQKAKESARWALPLKDSGYKPGEIHRTKIPRGVATMFAAKGQLSIIRIYRKTHRTITKKTEYKIHFELVNEDTNDFISKHFAYTSSELEDSLHRGHLYKVQFNSVAKYPIIESVIEEVLIPKLN